jgi:hypothetical protein
VAVLADGPVVSGSNWQGTRDAGEVPVVPRRAQYGDPAALHFHRRPHPLPGANWLEDTEDDGAVLPAAFAVPDTEPRTERLRLPIPPGATRMRFTPRAEVTEILVDGVPLMDAHPDASGMYDVVLPPGDRPARRAELGLRTLPEHREGAALAGPITFAVGRGTIELGDWENVGLSGYSGGVRYSRVLNLETASETAVLDLGNVRGTAEVTVNGVAAGIRICAPYTFDLGTTLREGDNEIEVTIYGTLAPYLDDTSPTHFIFQGQRTTGLLGPVTLRIPEDDSPSG